MAINLQSVIAAIEAKAAAADSTTSISDLYKIIIEANEVGIPMGVYDSAGVMPIDSAYVGSVFSTPAGGLYVLDSAGGSWQTADGSPAPIPYAFGGTNYGYTSGGNINPGYQNTIDTFSFTSDGNATDVGDLTVAREAGAGQSSTISGYTSGGYPDTLVIDKFPFMSGGNATTVGNLTHRMYGGSGHHTENNGYHGGGYWGGNLTAYSNINEISFAADGNATTVGNLSTARYPSTGQSSSTDGYSMNTTIRDKFPFASGGTAVDLSNLPTTRFANAAGQSSSTDGYYTTMKNDYTTTFIDKYPFASDAFLADVGDMTVLRYNTVGQSSTTYGYTSGGISPQTSPAVTNIVDKFPFANGGTATDVGDMTVNRMRPAGQQY